MLLTLLVKNRRTQTGTAHRVDNGCRAPLAEVQSASLSAPAAARARRRTASPATTSSTPISSRMPDGPASSSPRLNSSQLRVGSTRAAGDATPARPATTATAPVTRAPEDDQRV